jgi:hypothetical protein
LLPSSLRRIEVKGHVNFPKRYFLAKFELKREC